MRRWWLVVALVLSLGINIGILASMAVHRGAVSHQRHELARERGMVPSSPGRNGGSTSHEERWRWPQAPLSRLADRLGLSGDKREQFLALQRRLFVETVAARRQFMAKRRELHRELVAEHPDQDKINALSDEVGKQVTVLDRSLAETVLATRKILDPGQLEIYLGFLRRLEERGRGGPGRPGGPMPGRRPGPDAPNAPSAPPPGP